MSKRRILIEIIGGFDALKADREGKITLRHHAAKSKAAPKESPPPTGNVCR